MLLLKLWEGSGPGSFLDYVYIGICHSLYLYSWVMPALAIVSFYLRWVGEGYGSFLVYGYTGTCYSRQSIRTMVTLILLYILTVHRMLCYNGVI